MRIKTLFQKFRHMFQSEPVRPFPCLTLRIRELEEQERLSDARHAESGKETGKQQW